jgi:hypothetical protein
LFGSGPHDVTRHWHLAEHLVPKVDRGVITIESASAHIIITAADDHCEQELAIGSIDPIGGWISRCFGSKIPSHTVRWRNRMLDNMILKTRISILR